MKNTVCAVLTYLQSTFDFSQVPANDHIKIEFRHSFKNPNNPLPLALGYFSEIAYAEILIPNIINSQNGYYGGYVHDKITDYPLYQSYAYNGIDGRIRLNLEGSSQNTVTSTVQFHCNHNTNVNDCETDLYGTVLHEMLHLMGWFSMLDIVPFSLNPTHNNTFSLNQNTFSKLDNTYLYHQANPLTNTGVEKWVINSVSGPIINPTLTGSASAINDRNTFVKGIGRINDNHPVFTQDNQGFPNNFNAGILSHLGVQSLMLGDRYWITPGHIPSYVLSHRIPCGNQRRQITILEVKLLTNLGLPINPYPEYQPVAEWMDENDLYRQLDHDVALRTSNTTLAQFYDVQHQDATRYIAETNDLIDALAQDLTAMSAVDYQNLLAQAEQRNANIVSTALHEQNERIINHLYLRYLRYGSDSLGAGNAFTIQELATQCPYIGGTAVYKARTLYAMYQPGFYIDDMVVCNAAGVYKNGNGLFDEENELLKDMQNQMSSAIDDRDVLKIFPNPTQGLVHIRSELPFDNGHWVLQDMSGRVIAQGVLLDKAYSEQIALSGVAAGIYSLNIENASKVSNLKLVIE